MTLQQLRYAITIADSTSMNEAAKQLFISQPSLSSSIRDLEEELWHGAVHPQQPGNYADTGGQ